MVSGVWQPALASSVIGAAHQRQGKPCQDASLSCSLKAGCDQLQLMAVADGHGSEHYWLSQVGSALACTQARKSVSKLLDRTPLTAIDRWRQLLQQDLPAAIHSGWMAAIEADWRNRQEQDQPFSPLTYGCTLGLVLMAPQWWGCTGLGDWDLAGVQKGGSVRLLSREADLHQVGGEATTSLCQPFNQQLWLARTQLHQLDADDLLQSLILSTDGVRKSCPTDTDYLQLCAGATKLKDSMELSQGLARITAQGSGDDVSLTIAVRKELVR
ncbi:protein phosphatase 2C domain-containing protein [Synechococcus sp. AH-601-C19]|nr:protein phosphatase 2C domain-containing protein [Synechococcus sp. AH-601-C19]